MSVKAYLFDMDGTLADSEKKLTEHFFNLSKKYGFKGTYEECVSKIICQGDDGLVRFFNEFVPEKTKEEILEIVYEGLIVKNFPYKDCIYPETEKVLTTLKNEGYKLALVTSNSKEFYEDFLSNLPKDTFDCVVSSEELHMRGKPAPDTYSYAMKLLGVKAHECIVVEDTSFGVEAGLAAGAYVIGTTQTSVSNDVSMANRNIKNLIELIR